jgi:arylsulfatase A-like enzyme
VWCFYDVFPTLADLVGAPAPKNVDGISFLPALVEGKSVEHPPLYWEFHEGGFFQAARMGNWKAVKNGKDGAIELYDLAADVAEEHDVAAAHPEVVTKFAEFLKSARTESEQWKIKETVRRRRA